jgi:hypothetical protein
VTNLQNRRNISFIKEMAAAPNYNTLAIIIIALLIDLLAFTIILPLFPRLLKFYDFHSDKDSLYTIISNFISSLRRLVSNESRLDIILFGGLVGSMYSFLQFISSPVIGRYNTLAYMLIPLLWSNAF